MKKGLLILVLALAAGVLAFWITRSHQQAERQAVLLDSMPELAWLRVELKLSDEQFAKASELHVAYRPTCEVMCRNIAEAHARLETLARSGRAMSPELAAATAIKLLAPPRASAPQSNTAEAICGWTSPRVCISRVTAARSLSEKFRSTAAAVSESTESSTAAAFCPPESSTMSVPS